MCNALPAHTAGLGAGGLLVALALSMVPPVVQAQAAVQSEGAVIFRYSSARNPSLTRYDRYVRHDGYCQWNEYAANAWIPTRDTDECFVRSCKPRGYGLGGLWRD